MAMDLTGFQNVARFKNPLFAGLLKGQLIQIVS